MKTKLFFYFVICFCTQLKSQLPDIPDTSKIYTFSGYFLIESNCLGKRVIITNISGDAICRDDGFFYLGKYIVKNVNEYTNYPVFYHPWVYHELDSLIDPLVDQTILNLSHNCKKSKKIFGWYNDIDVWGGKTKRKKGYVLYTIRKLEVEAWYVTTMKVFHPFEYEKKPVPNYILKKITTLE